jgi:phage tail sheath protein FI
MPTYLSPGVYIQEINTGNQPIEGVSTSTVGFLGVAERGPATPTLITSFTEYARTFGGYIAGRYLAHAVEGFFTNGGQLCYVARVVPSKTTKPVAATANFGGMDVTAVGPGDWGNSVSVTVATSAVSNTLFDLSTSYTGVNGQTLTESFPSLGTNANLSNYYPLQVNGASLLVIVSVHDATAITPGTKKLTGGASSSGDPVAPLDVNGDPTLPPGQHTGLLALGETTGISILCCPEENSADFAAATITQNMVAQAQNQMDRIAILQAPITATPPQNMAPPVASTYAAYYAPWLTILHPITGLPLDMPPGGHIAGIYARSDSNRGVQKAPANEAILGIQSLKYNYTKGDQDVLNPKGVNLLRYFPGGGNLVWGARTTTLDPDWKYVNVRRLFIFIEQSIERSTQWVVFEDNDSTLWAQVRRSVSSFLTTLWMDGMLMGAKKEDAYFVKCDNTTMTQNDIDNGRLIMIIGIAPVKPAEFVIFQIGQWEGGSSVTEGQ